jgi:predicted Abi (CAAX) family protease
MMARYRTGDGTGNSSVTPAASCVQDSNQALFITIEVLKQQVSQTPEIITWLTNNPDDPQSKRFQRLVQLGDRLTKVFTNRGVIRTDWKENAETLASVTTNRNHSGFVRESTLANALISWGSMLPRFSHDIISKIFLEHGATLWFLRTNQVGGEMPEILPLAPTNLFGDVPLLSAALRRILVSFILLPSAQGWAITFGLLMGYAAIAIPIGLKFQFLQWRPRLQNPIQLTFTLIGLFFCPAFFEELFFRVILLPYPDGYFSLGSQFGLILLSLALFVFYHPLNALTFYKVGNPIFFNPTFLGLTALLGITCTIAYLVTGSIWTISVLHWIVVSVWLLGFNGLSQFKARSI